jgi:hypothetical protein
VDTGQILLIPCVSLQSSNSWLVVSVARNEPRNSPTADPLAVFESTHTIDSVDFQLPPSRSRFRVAGPLDALEEEEKDWLIIEN